MRRGLILVVVAVALVLLVAHQLSGPPSRGEQAYRLEKRLRCPTCQGISVADSPSPIARTIRRVIDSELNAGRDPRAIEADLVATYGDWILLEPPNRGLGLIVWWLPPVAMLIGLVLVGRRVWCWADGGQREEA
ncbi:cytochrome c-type biogenesis protein CcmH [Nonomuraea sp. NPDC005692]|uniref:cytochrome c-type biogenesis protein n=1 Tax=Nonomuraea sp. NPDC005692 TaxID=3157168 RepID=UPI0033C63812